MSKQNKTLKLKVRYGKTGIILTAIFALLIFCDLILKYLAWKFCWQFTVIPGLIEVVPMQYNPGAAFSFLSDKSWAQTFFIVLTFIMVAVMIFAFFVLPKSFLTMRISLVLLCAGAIGNLVDRLIWGCVRDFVDIWMFGGFACCNFADFWITFGVALLIIDMLFLNEWAVIPLTKTAKAAQAKRNEEEKNSALQDAAPEEEESLLQTEEAEAEKDNQNKDGDGV